MKKLAEQKILEYFKEFVFISIKTRLVLLSNYKIIIDYSTLNSIHIHLDIICFPLRV